MVSSSSHPLARLCRQLSRSPSSRRREGLFLAEGPRLLEEGLAAGPRPAWLLLTGEAEERYEALVARTRTRGIDVHHAKPELLRRIAPTEHGQGLLAAFPLPEGADDPATLLESLGPESLVVVCWEIGDPGSVGTLVRSAAAFGAQALVALGGADPWNAKAVRASAGALFRLPLARALDAEALLNALSAGAFRILATAPRGGRDPDEEPFAGRVALLLGAEVEGLPKELLAQHDTLTISTSGLVESLSVPMAGTVLLASAQRSRRGGVSD